ncbi:ADP-ribose pyrophosphatase YjhB, NUDIX family [Mesobacillus persicus]|uniref:ADP-ribose pyrophosphatase YjhB, NUDIX family n=1 Tax=Mesobacillus persicus TaxID=930146 RepID=A0A1H7ZV17_9BACI|nr:NUDIX hydrolase [Mesobacillus persicus]SEM61614.1 ADP-ribose pyrophosphatase YjhB, NUDIX family [Mesobacillus persicus]
MTKRGKVWLAVAGLVVAPNGDWLVVKKKYGGLKNQWSLPAGFVEAGETADEAVLREVAEETGIKCELKGMVGLRTGVIRNDISDNMIVFLLAPLEGQKVTAQESELYEACYLDPNELVQQPNVSVMLKYFINLTDSGVKPPIDGINPGTQFEYTAYKLFL